MEELRAGRGIAQDQHLDEVGGDGEFVGYRKTGAQGGTQLHRLAPKGCRIACLAEGTASIGQASRISPFVPFTGHARSVLDARVASVQPTTPGIPYSRLTIAAWDKSPPVSVTIAPIMGRTMLNASVVVEVTSTSPG